MEYSVQLSLVTQLCPTLYDPMNHSTPGLPVHHQLPEFTQTHVIESVMPSSHLILWRPLLLLPPIPPSIRVFSNVRIWIKHGRIGLLDTHVSELDREAVKKLRVQISYKVTLMNYFQLVILLQSQNCSRDGYERETSTPNARNLVKRDSSQELLSL